MDEVQDDAVTEFLKILGKAEHEVRSLPQTSADFETCSLRSTLCGQLDAQLGAAVDKALGSQELRLDPADGVCPDGINKVVARLAASPPFVGVVNKAREAIEQAAEAQLAAATTPVANATGDSVAATGAAGVVLRRNVDALSSSDTEREDMRVKKKAARRDDWVGIFDLSGGLGAGGGISPRVDIEAALGQLETGLGGSGSSTTSSVEALGLLAQANPELFQFGNHWPLFLKLAKRALDSPDPTVHAKAMTLHWVMYEKSMGMCAADMCEGVLAHARGYFSNTIHVLSAPSAHRRHMLAGGKGAETADVGTANLMVIGDSKLACAARMSRALHGMLVTIHETFQHLPERRVWSIVSSFFSLLGDTVASLEGAPGDPTGDGAPPTAADPSRGDPPLLLLMSLVEELLEEELPLMSVALRGSGWAAAPLAARWVRQCMLSVVDWPGVVAFLALSLLRGHDYQVYFVVALFRAAQPSVMEAASKGLDLTGLLGRGEALEAFNLEESLSFMEALERRHRGRCIAATKAYLAQC
ncbi:conserved unknown protein [Ectocarpus siliculosus]|uniref:BROMI C-terminal Rab TBC-like domain-containing protein n=1 Tax=Ectocarpus siliculosus TaxID=2880 RepID=D8LGY7_ECTSI|nr:conserved unknown protein [Ectocarpus siliculosus]|eukprot:CBN75840.1 conserved unknown protein [Ectocarpus siliculosus]